MERRTITTPNDLIGFAALPKDFPKCDLRRIGTIERKVFRECIGNDLYRELLDALAEYEAENYKAGTEYPAGKAVVYSGVVYVSKEATDEPPTKSEFWEKVPRFEKECLERLWCMVLGEYLAYSILIPNMPLILLQIRNGTVLRVAGKDMVVGNNKDLQIVTKALEFFRDMAWDNLVAFVEDHNVEGCYDGFRLCKPCSVRKRQKGVRIG